VSTPQDHQEIPRPQEIQNLQNPQPFQSLENSFNLNHSSSSSDTFLTPFFQNKNRNKKEPEEGRDSQGKGEIVSAIAESRSVFRGENKNLKDPEIINLKPINPKPKTHKTNQDPQTIMDFYNQEFHGLWKGPLRLTKERERQIKARLKSFTVEELKTAITNLRQSTFHCGENDKERIYGRPEYLFKNDSQVDKWLNEKPRLNPCYQNENWDQKYDEDDLYALLKGEG